MSHRERRIGEDIYGEIMRLGWLGRKQAEIERVLQDNPDFIGRVPHRRTIKRILDQDLPSPGDPWSFAHEPDPESGRLVMDVLRYVIKESQSRVRYISIDQARWIIRLRRAYPAMPDDVVWQWTQKYMEAEQAGRETVSLDGQVAFRSWESPENRVEEQKAQARAWANMGFGTFTTRKDRENGKA